MHLFIVDPIPLLPVGPILLLFVDPILPLSVDPFPPLATDLIPADPVPPGPCGFVLQLGKSRSQGSAAAALLAMATAGLRQGFSFQLQSWMSNSLGDSSKGRREYSFPWGALGLPVP